MQGGGDKSAPPSTRSAPRDTLEIPNDYCGICLDILRCPFDLLLALWDCVTCKESRLEAHYRVAKSKITFDNGSSEPALERAEIPFGYEHVRGPKMAREFMKSTEDPSIITQVARAAELHAHPLDDPNSYLVFEDLVLAASARQIKALTEACEGDKYRLRKLFSTLLWGLTFSSRSPETQSGVIKKIKIALKCAGDSVMDMFVLHDCDRCKSSTPFQWERHAIQGIPAERFLKWKDELGLSTEFVRKCQDMAAYQEHVVRKAEEESVRVGKLATD